MITNLLSSTIPCINFLGIAPTAAMRTGTGSLAGMSTSAWLFSQLIDQPGKREQRTCRCSRLEPEDINQKPEPNPPERTLNDSQPLADNKTSIKFT